MLKILKEKNLKIILQWRIYRINRSDKKWFILILSMIL